MFKIIEGAVKTEYYPKKASQAISQGALVYLDSNGQVDVCASGTGNILGRAPKAVASTDSDYAANTMFPVEILTSENVLEGDVTGTFATTNVGDYLDLSTSLVVDAAASTTDVLFCTGYVSSSVGRFKIAKPQSIDC